MQIISCQERCIWVFTLLMLTTSSFPPALLAVLWKSGDEGRAHTDNKIMSNIVLMFTLLLWRGEGLRSTILSSPLDYIAHKECSPRATVKAHTLHKCLTKCFTISLVLVSTPIKVSCRSLLWHLCHGKDSGHGPRGAT